MKKWLICLLVLVLLLSCCACGWMEQGNTDLYVLMYHSVVKDGEFCGDWTISTSRFREHMQWLKDEGYTTVLPSELVAGEELPEKAVLITFDDGYADNYTNAFPILKEFGHKAVISIVTSYIGDAANGWMTWDMCREIQASGLVEFGSHTHNLHRYPGILRQENETREEYTQRVFPDIQESIDQMEANLGVTPQFFAYPHGNDDEWAVERINELFPVTVVTDTGVADISDGLHGMLRYNINDKTVLADYMTPQK